MTAEQSVEHMYAAGWRLQGGERTPEGKWICHWTREDRAIEGSGATPEQAQLSAYRAAMHGLGGKRRAA